LSQGLTGVQRYATELVRALDRQLGTQRRNETSPWSLLAPPNARALPGLNNIAVRRCGALRGQLWEQLELSRFARDGLLINLANTAPIGRRSQVVTIHDASVFAVPGAYTWAFRTWYRFLMPRIGKRSRLVFTDSQFSRSELASRAGIPLDRQRVIPLGCDHMIAVAADESVLARHEIADRPFVLAVGSSSPHKNVAMVARAVAEWDDRGNDWVLVIAGTENPAIFANTGPHRSGRVKWLGSVSDGALRALYQRAICLVYPSLYEGFGLPPLEAMICGCPTLVARTASLPEVCGDAALYFDPRDPAELTRGLEQLATNEKARAELRARGLAHARNFTWERTARGILDVLAQEGITWRAPA
jgi:glycosyltransferase involved in cell wall biosynthesis